MHDTIRHRSPGRRAAILGLALLISSLAFLVLRAPASEAAPVEKDAVLLETEEAPWGEEFDFEAMETAFGTNWELQQFERVQADEAAGGLFAPAVEFIWIEGSDESTEAAAEFVAAHEAQLRSFVDRGGSLFVNAGTNQDIAVEFDGREIGHYDGSDIETEKAEAVDPGQPIFNEPDPLGSTTFTGNAFASGNVTGATVTPLLVNSEEGSENEGAVVLATYTSGLGHVVLGTMTAAQYQEPESDAKALRINLLDYLKELAIPGVPTNPVTSPAPAPVAGPAPVTAPATVSATPVCTMPNLKGLRLGAARKALKAADCSLGKGEVRRQRGVSAKKGKVVRQSRKPGDILPAHTRVSVKLG